MEIKPLLKKENARMKFVKVFLPCNSSIPFESLHTVFAPWIEESGNSNESILRKEVINEKGRSDNSGFDNQAT